MKLFRSCELLELILSWQQILLQSPNAFHYASSVIVSLLINIRELYILTIRLIIITIVYLIYLQVKIIFLAIFFGIIFCFFLLISSELCFTIFSAIFHLIAVMLLRMVTLVSPCDFSYAVSPSLMLS